MFGLKSERKLPGVSQYCSSDTRGPEYGQGSESMLGGSITASVHKRAHTLLERQRSSFVVGFRAFPCGAAQCALSQMQSPPHSPNPCTLFPAGSSLPKMVKLIYGYLVLSVLLGILSAEVSFRLCNCRATPDNKEPIFNQPGSAYAFDRISSLAIPFIPFTFS
jgi:hypothetical protein